MSYRENLHLVVRDKKEALPKYLSYLNCEFKTGIVSVITGGPGAKMGAGKTTTAARIGETQELYSNKHYGTNTKFDASKMHFVGSEFMNCITTIEEKIDTIHQKGDIGQVIVLDEAERAASSSNYYKMGNLVIADTIRTSRELQCHFIFIAPVFADIDKRIRKLVNFWGYPEIHMGANRQKVCNLRFYNIRTDNKGENLKLRSLKFYVDTEEEVGLRTVEKFTMNMIETPGLKDAIDLKAHLFKRDLRKELMRDMIKFEKDESAIDNKKFNLNDSVAMAMRNEQTLKQLEKKGKVTANFIRTLTLNRKSDELIFENINNVDASAVAARISSIYGKERDAEEEEE